MFPHEDCQASAQVAQRGCASPSLEVFKTHLDKAMSIFV